MTVVYQYAVNPRKNIIPAARPVRDNQRLKFKSYLTYTVMLSKTDKKNIEANYHYIA